MPSSPAPRACSYLRKGKGEQRIARIEQHPCMPVGDATFQIAAAGIINPTE